MTIQPDAFDIDIFLENLMNNGANDDPFNFLEPQMDVDDDGEPTHMPNHGVYGQPTPSQTLNQDNQDFNLQQYPPQPFNPGYQQQHLQQGQPHIQTQLPPPPTVIQPYQQQQSYHTHNLPNSPQNNICPYQSRYRSIFGLLQSKNLLRLDHPIERSRSLSTNFNCFNHSEIVNLISNHFPDFIYALQEEMKVINQQSLCRRLIDKITEAFIYTNQPIPTVHLQNLINSVFPNFGIHSPSPSDAIIWNIIFENINVLESILNDTSGNKSAMYERRRLLTVFACKYGYKALINRLAETKYINFTNPKDETISAIDWLCIRGDSETLRLFSSQKSFSARFKKDLINSDAVGLSVEHNHPQVLEFALQRGCNVNKPNNHGKLPIMTALERKHYDMIETLLRTNKIDLAFHTNYAEDTVIHSVIKSQDERALSIILNDATEDHINKKNVEGKTALHLACELSFEAGVKLLVDQKANRSLKDKNGNTALHIAFRGESPKIQNLIFGNGSYPHQFEENRTGKNIFDIVLEKIHHYNFIDLFNAVYTLQNAECFKNALTQIQAALTRKANTLPERSDWVTKLEQEVLTKLPSQYNLIVSNLFLKIMCEVGSEDEIIEFVKCQWNEKRFSKENIPLDILISRKMTKVIEVLIPLGIDIGVKNDDGLNLLHLSILHQNERAACILLNSRPGLLNEVDNNGLTALHHACRVKNNFIINILISKGASVKAKTAHGDTPLHFVCHWYSENLETVSSLLANGASPNAINNAGLTPTYFACQYGGNLDTLELMIKSYASVCIPSPSGATLLHLLCLNQGNASEKLLRVIDLLIKNGADINAKDANGLTPLYYALMTNSDARLVEKLLDLKADYTTAIQNKITPLHLLCLHGKYKQIVYELIAKGANLYSEDAGGLQPMHYAIHVFDWQRPMLVNGIPEKSDVQYSCDVIVKTPAVLDTEMEISFNPWRVTSFDQSGQLIRGTYDGKNWSNCEEVTEKDISEALITPTVEILQILFNNGIKITKPEPSLFKHVILTRNLELFDKAIEALDISDEHSLRNILSEALVFASNNISKESMNTIKKILNKGASIDAVDENGKTWLQRECAKEGNLDKIRTVLLLGANVNKPLPDNTWKTPFYMLLEKHHKHFGLINLARKNGANVNFSDRSKETLLHHAIYNYLSDPSQNKLNLIIRLIEQGADVNSKNVNGVIPIHLLSKIKNNDITKLLPEVITVYNINQKDRDGATPFFYACESCVEEQYLVDLREKYDADHTIVTLCNQTTLHSLAKNTKISRYDDAVINSNKKYLLKVDSDGETICSIALKNNRWELFRLCTENIVNYFNSIKSIYNMDQLGLDLSSTGQFMNSLSQTSMLLTTTPFICEIYAPIIELYFLLGLHSAIGPILETMTYSQFEEVLFHFESKCGYDKEDVAKARMFMSYKVNYANIPNLVINDEIPLAPEGNSVKDLETMFEEMNNAYGHQYNGKFTEIKSFVSKVTNRKSATGAPNKEKYPEDFQKFYDTIENLTKHLVHSFKNVDAETRKEYLLLTADFVSHCGTRWNEEFTMLYNLFADKPIAKTFIEQMILSLQQLRTGIIEEDAGQNVHKRNKSKYLAGKKLGIPTPTAYNDTTFGAITEQERNREISRLTNLCFSKYDTTRICAHLINEISFIYRNMRSREMLLIWLRTNVPNDYEILRYQHIQSEVQDMEKIHCSHEEIVNYLKSVDVYLKKDQNYFEAIKEDRIGSFINDAIDYSILHKTTLSPHILISILKDNNIIMPINFRPEINLQKRSYIEMSDQPYNINPSKLQKISDSNF